ncbi:hypothetical protein NH340_JMT08435 [Sarcoptes scabiei]|uniref:Uncharacterized protein n=1 Tax=Sarcoptes scabiei TaxID=52283 RepID=A0A132A844_SARSC|nr:hypothetical protein QR98_0056170 [Sarcoptes scabiei]UXI22492.1 hypothetical protein NH340_JMT08435 [Sarcoptes scabiei]
MQQINRLDCQQEEHQENFNLKINHKRFVVHSRKTFNWFSELDLLFYQTDANNNYANFFGGEFLFFELKINIIRYEVFRFRILVFAPNWISFQSLSKDIYGRSEQIQSPKA